MIQDLFVNEMPYNDRRCIHGGLTAPAWLNATPVPLGDEIQLVRSTLAGGWRSSSSLEGWRAGWRREREGVDAAVLPRANKSLQARHWADTSIHGFRAQAPRRETAWRCPGKGFARSHLRCFPRPRHRDTWATRVIQR